MTLPRSIRLLLDENIAEAVAAPLRERGWQADHAKPLELDNQPDAVVLAFAVAHDYDAIVTKDRYAKRDARLPALRAMRDGLRIIQLRFRQEQLGSGDAAEQLRLILNHEREIERVIARDSQIRQIILNHTVGAITRTVTADEVAAELSRIEA